MEYTLHDGTIVDLDDDDISMIFNDKCNNIIKVWFVEDLANHKSRSEKEHNFISSLKILQITNLEARKNTTSSLRTRNKFTMNTKNSIGI